MLDLKRFRKAKNIQQKDIVKLLEISQAYVSDMERGLKPVSKESYETTMIYLQSLGLLFNETIRTANISF